MADMDQKDSALVVNHGSGMCLLGFPGVPAPRAVFFPPVVRPMMLDIMAGMNQKDSCLEEYRKIGFYWEMTSYVSIFSSLVRQWILICVSLQRPGLWFRLQKTVDFPQLQFFVGRRFSCHGAEADSHGLAVQQTIVILQLQFMNKVIDVPGMQVAKVLPVVAPVCNDRCPSQLQYIHKIVIFPFRGAEAYPHVPAVQPTIEIPLLPYMWLASPVARADSQVPPWRR